MNVDTPYWRKCTTCKKLIGFNQKYWVCSVSTCNRQRTGLVFCSVTCFDAHIPVMNHRDAGAFEKHSPTEAEWRKQQAEQSAPSAAPKATPKPATTPITSSPSSAPSIGASPSGQAMTEQEILVVVSKVKDYIRSRSGMNTSESVMRRLTTWVTRWCDESVRRAAQEDRKTVLDRDVR